MNRFYEHVLCLDAMRNDDLWPLPIMDFLCTAGIVVDSSARRFTDEGLGGVSITNALAALPDPLSAIVIFDKEIWNGPGREYLPPTNPALFSNGGTLYTAADLKGLVSKLGLPAAALEETVAQAVDASGRKRSVRHAPRASTSLIPSAMAHSTR